jgi:deoxyribodipyrimidine photo-lyase
MPELELAAAGVTLGKTYPHPIISHEDGRASALKAYEEFKESIR